MKYERIKVYGVYGMVGLAVVAPAITGEAAEKVSLDVQWVSAPIVAASTSTSASTVAFWHR